MYNQYLIANILFFSRQENRFTVIANKLPIFITHIVCQQVKSIRTMHNKSNDSICLLEEQDH